MSVECILEGISGIDSLWSVHGTFLSSYCTDVFAGAGEMNGVCGKAKSVSDLCSHSALVWKMLVLSTDSCSVPVTLHFLFILVTLLVSVCKNEEKELEV